MHPIIYDPLTILSDRRAMWTVGGGRNGGGEKRDWGPLPREARTEDRRERGMRGGGLSRCTEIMMQSTEKSLRNESKRKDEKN